MVILDELNVAADFKLIPLDEVVDLIKSKPAAVDLILTGRPVGAQEALRNALKHGAPRTITPMLFFRQ